LILVDPGDYEIAARNVQMMEAEQGLTLRYIFSTHHHEKHNGQNEKFLARWPEIKIVAGIMKKWSYLIILKRKLWNEEAIPYNINRRNQAF